MIKKLMVLLITLTAFAYTQNYSEFEKSDNYGENFTQSDTVLISQLLESPDKYVGKKVLVKGVITDVCKKRGCWMNLASDEDFQEITIKVKDGEIVFPLEAKGKTAMAEGIFEAIELPQEKAISYYKHKAEEQGKDFDPSTITGPVKIYRIKGSGAQIDI